MFAIADSTPRFIGESGQDIFLRVDQHLTIGEPRVLILTPVASGLARQEMRWLAYIPRKKALASNVNMDDPRTPEEPKFGTRQPDQ